MARPQRPKLAVPEGCNVWRLLRTDRDGQTEAKIPQNAAAAVRYFLGLGLSPQENQQLVPVAHWTWRFGNVRPLEVLSVGHEEPPLTSGQILADRQRVPDTVPTVSGKHPWWVLLRFWWRQPGITIDYPGVRQGLLWPSWTLDGADWLLDRAHYVSPSDVQDPGAATWTDAVTDHAQAEFLAKTGHLGDLLATGSALAVLLALYLLSKR
jgi:hypothetical protein